MTAPAPELAGKRIIVTGGARGIGEAAVRAFARAGAAVVSLDVQRELGEEVVADAAREGPGTASFLHCEIQRRDAVESAFAAAVAGVAALFTRPERRDLRARFRQTVLERAPAPSEGRLYSCPCHPERRSQRDPHPR